MFTVNGWLRNSPLDSKCTLTTLSKKQHSYSRPSNAPRPPSPHTAHRRESEGEGNMSMLSGKQLSLRCDDNASPWLSQGAGLTTLNRMRCLQTLSPSLPLSLCLSLSPSSNIHGRSLSLRLFVCVCLSRSLSLSLSLSVSLYLSPPQKQ